MNEIIQFKPKATYYRFKSTAKPSPERPLVAKVRICLMTGLPFASRWSGERICPRCKDKEEYRDWRKAIV